jgi:hypothetical protein
MRPEKSGRKILIKNPDDFEAWLETTAQDGTAGGTARIGVRDP